MTTTPTPRLSKHQPLPHFTGTIAMIWFLAGLGMLFGAGMLGYLMVRINRAQDVAIGSVHLPNALWASTALVLIASVAIQMAVAAIRRERQDLLRAWLVVTLVVGLLFCIVQAPALTTLMREHFRQLAAFDAAGGRAAGAYVQPFFGMIAVFIFIHAGHVLGGIIQLIIVTRSAFLGRYDHEYYNPVKHAAMYWHFLDVVWLVMYGTMLATG